MFLCDFGSFNVSYCVLLFASVGQNEICHKEKNDLFCFGGTDVGISFETATTDMVVLDHHPFYHEKLVPPKK